jgi:hypothetical protein
MVSFRRRTSKSTTSPRFSTSTQFFQHRSLLVGENFSATTSVVISNRHLTIATLMMNILERGDAIGDTSTASKEAHQRGDSTATVSDHFFSLRKARENLLNETTRFFRCDSHGPHTAGGANDWCTLTLQRLERQALKVLLLWLWLRGGILVLLELVCRRWVCKWRLGER